MGITNEELDLEDIAYLTIVFLVAKKSKMLWKK
jgi:hypothetical protein